MEQPLDHKRFLASLSPELRQSLTRLENAPGVWRLAGHGTVILGLMAWVGLGLPLWHLALLPLGIALSALFMLQHECTHATPFRSPWMNEVAGQVAGFVIVQPFLWFRAFHMAHHRFTNDPDRDPELTVPNPRTFREMAWYLIGIGYWAEKLRQAAQNAFCRLDAPYITPRQVPRMRREARAMMAGYAVLALASPWIGAYLFWLWLLPLALGTPFLRLYLLAEHGRCPKVANMFDNTRTTFTNRPLRYLAWNMPFHAEHHAWPAVPFHRLDDLHHLARIHLRQTGPGYTSFTRSYLATMDKPD